MTDELQKVFSPSLVPVLYDVDKIKINAANILFIPPLVTVLYDVENNSNNPAKFLSVLEKGVLRRFPGCFLRKYVVCCAGTLPQVRRQREELALTATLVDTGVQESQRADKIIEKICKQTLDENCVNGAVFRPFITILVSGDGDFVPMLKTVSAAGGMIVVVANTSVLSQDYVVMNKESNLEVWDHKNILDGNIHEIMGKATATLRELTNTVPEKDRNHNFQCPFYFTKGKECPYGLRCRYAHNPELPLPERDVCRRFQKGKCMDANHCIFEHRLLVANNEPEKPKANPVNGKRKKVHLFSIFMFVFTVNLFSIFMFDCLSDAYRRPGGLSGLVSKQMQVQVVPENHPCQTCEKN
jgi:hypothetical protein